LLSTPPDYLAHPQISSIPHKKSGGCTRNLGGALSNLGYLCTVHKYDLCTITYAVTYAVNCICLFEIVDHMQSEFLNFVAKQYRVSFKIIIFVYVGSKWRLVAWIWIRWNSNWILVIFYLHTLKGSCNKYSIWWRNIWFKVNKISYNNSNG
jgi:hypothetical protein